MIIGISIFLFYYINQKKVVNQTNNKTNNPINQNIFKTDFDTQTKVKNINLSIPNDGKKYVSRPRSIQMPQYRFDLPIKDRFVLAHNFFRKEHCAPGLKWNPDLAKLAENWGKNIANQRVMKHPISPEETKNFGLYQRRPIGQNIGVGVGQIFSAGDNYINHPEDIVAAWQEEKNIPNFEQTKISLNNQTITFSPSLDERKQRSKELINKMARPRDCQGIKYNFENHECNPNNLYGHMTQVVWKGSKELGCAQVLGKDGQNIYSVCNYFPAGNVIGKYKENVIDSSQC